MSDSDMQAEIERLRAENEKLKKKQTRQVYMKVSQKGAVSVYGLQRYPVTLYKEQWEKLLDMADDVREFMIENANYLKVKESRAQENLDLER